MTKVARMAKNQRLKKSLFIIRPAKNGQSWFVFLSGRSAPVYEFASEKAALNWIEYSAKSWLRKRHAVRRA